MKTQKLALVVLVAVALLAGTSLQGFATPTALTCTVLYAGPQTSPSYKMAFKLIYASGSPAPANRTAKVFYAPTGKEKEFLAVALTALATGKKVMATVDFDDTANTTVLNLYELP